MHKDAQKRESAIRKLLTTDVGDYLGGKSIEKKFPEFAQVIDKLNTIDDNIRGIVTGESVDGQTDSIGLKSLLKSAKSNINKREYMKAISDLGRFHKKAFEIVKLLSLFKIDVDRLHEKFLFQDLDEESRKYLSGFKDKWAHDSEFSLIKKSNILDFFTNVTTERGRALAAWEKRYPNKIKKLKNDTISLLAQSDKLLNTIISNLKEMDRARTVRNPDKYIISAERIINLFKNYDTNFKEYYENNVKGFLEKQEFFAPTKIDTTNTPNELGKKEITAPELSATVPASPLPGALIPTPSKIPSLPPVPQLKPTELDKSTTPTTEPPFDQTRTTQMDIKLPEKSTGAHRKFFDSLESMSNESPILLAMHINKYAKSIWSIDPDVAIELFKISKSIKG